MAFYHKGKIYAKSRCDTDQEGDKSCRKMKVTARDLQKLYGVRSQGLIAHFSLLILCGLILVGVELTIPVLTKVLFDFVYREKQFEVLNTIIFVMMALLGVQFALKSTFDFLALVSKQLCTIRMKKKVFQKIQNLEVRTFHEQSQGSLIVKVTEDVDRMFDLLLMQRMDLFCQSSQIIGILGFCIWIEPHAVLVFVLSIPVYLFASRYLLRNELGIVRDKLIYQRSVILDYLRSVFQQSAVVRAFNQEVKETDGFEKLLREQTALQSQDLLLKTFFQFYGQLGFDWWHVAVNLYFGMGVMKGWLSVGDLIALVLLSSNLRQPLLGLNQQFGRFRSGFSSLKRIHELLSLKEGFSFQNVYSLFSDLKNQSMDQKIEIRNLKFGYSPLKPVFENLNLSLDVTGKYVAVVGNNGAGKSTLVHLLSGFEEKYEGQILIQGREIRTFNRRELRKNILFVSRDHGVFQRTLRENIAYGNPDVTDDQIVQAAKEVALWHEIQKLPQGLDTVLRVENEFSRSEKLKLAIARALVVQPKILILDEVTADFDQTSNYVIQESIQRLIQYCTVISITQDVSTLKKSNHVILFKDGRVEEQGNFYSLLQRKGEFFRYYVSNFGGFPEFKRVLSQEVERASRYKSQFALVAVQISNFDQLISNLDPKGAQKLCADILFALHQIIRESDSVSEVGNGIYLCLLPESGDRNAEQFLKRLEKELRSKIFQVEAKAIQVTCSGNFLFYHEKKKPPENVDKIIGQAINSLGIDKKYRDAA